jgi:hypothetical protein
VSACALKDILSKAFIGSICPCGATFKKNYFNIKVFLVFGGRESAGKVAAFVLFESSNVLLFAIKQVI